MQIEATAAGDEEAHLILCVAVLCEKLRASGVGLVTPAGVVVVGLHRGDVDVLVAAIAIECVDAVSVFGQDLGGGLRVSRPGSIGQRSKSMSRLASSAPITAALSVRSRTSVASVSAITCSSVISVPPGYDDGVVRSRGGRSASPTRTSPPGTPRGHGPGRGRRPRP